MPSKSMLIADDFSIIWFKFCVFMFVRMTYMKIIVLLRRFSERFHGEMHLMIGMICVLAVKTVFGVDLGWNLILLSVVGSFLPDVDHLVFIFGYGRKTQHSINSREYMRLGRFNELIVYWKKTHKDNTEIYSHNILFMFLFAGFFWLAFEKDAVGWGVFFLSIAGHFLYDILEDVLFMGKVNPNWYLRFGKKVLKESFFDADKVTGVANNDRKKKPLDKD